MSHADMTAVKVDKIRDQLGVDGFFDAIDVYETIEEFYCGEHVGYYNFNDLRVLE